MLFRTVLYVRYCKNNFLYDFAGFGGRGNEGIHRCAGNGKHRYELSYFTAYCQVYETQAVSFAFVSGALAGAAYVVVLLLMPNLKVYCTTLAKFALSLLIVAIAFSPAKPALFIKTLAVFYVSTFIFAGAAFAFLYLNQTGGFVRNGIVYIWNSKGTTLFLLWQPSA